MDNLLNLVAEVAERLDEMEDARIGSSVEVVTSLAQIAASSRLAYRLTIQHMHNSPERYLSYAAQAERRGVSRQAIHREFHRHITLIRQHLPAVADAIVEMRRVAEPRGRAKIVKTAPICNKVAKNCNKNAKL